MEFEACPE